VLEGLLRFVTVRSETVVFLGTSVQLLVLIEPPTGSIVTPTKFAERERERERERKEKRKRKRGKKETKDI